MKGEKSTLRSHPQENKFSVNFSLNKNLIQDEDEERYAKEEKVLSKEIEHDDILVRKKEEVINSA